MPISRYFHGHGEEVMRSMVKRNGAKDGKAEFYATANKRGEKPGAKKGAKRGSKS